MLKIVFLASQLIISGRWPCPTRSLWRLGINARGVHATLSTLMLIAALSMIHSPAKAFDEQASPIHPVESMLPDAADVVSAYAVMRKWVDQFDAPAMESKEARASIANSAGVCMILRRSGRILGVGIDTSSNDLMLRRAAGVAMNEVLGDPALASVSSALRKGALENHNAALTVESLRANLGRTLTIELEVAGKLTPLVGRSIDQIAAKLQPGLDGVALRQGELWHFAFPCHLRATNTGGDPTRSMLNLAMKAGFSINDMADLLQRADVSFYRFRTIHLLQNAPSAAPYHTYRGEVLVPQSSITQESIAKLADGLANHLMMSIWPEPLSEGDDVKPREPLGMMGNYVVVADQYRPLIAPPLDQALAAFALNRYSVRGQLNMGINRDRASAALHTAQKILQELNAVVAGEEDPHADPAASAAVIYAVSEHPSLRQDEAIANLFAHAVERMIDSFDPASGFIIQQKSSEHDQKRRSVVPAPHVQAMIAGALSRLLAMRDIKPEVIDAQYVRQALDAAWRSTPQPQHVALLPWIGWAEFDYAKAAAQPLAHVDVLRLMIDVLNDSRVGPASAENGPSHRGISGPPDLHGGFALTSESGATRSKPLATAQSVRPAAWLASAMNHAELNPTPSPEAADAVLRNQLSTVRFLIQLSVREEAIGAIRHPSRALGGLRAATWDSNQPLPAQALGLITAVETLFNLSNTN